MDQFALEGVRGDRLRAVGVSFGLSVGIHVVVVMLLVTTFSRAARQAPLVVQRVKLVWVDPAPAAGTPDQPVGAGERIVTLDFVRGIAVLGILFPNIVAYGNVTLAYNWPKALPGGPEPFDVAVWLFQLVLIDGKFRGLFTLLFGAGMMLFMERAWARGATRRLQARRLFWLALFGLAHFYLLWTGDILFMYALAGFGGVQRAVAVGRDEHLA